MAYRGSVATIWMALLVALSIGSAAPAAAQDSPGEYRTAIDNIFLEIRALWGELDRFKVEARYCSPSPPPPSKAQAQAELARLERRVNELNGRYNALKQSLVNFLDHNHRLYSEMMVNGRDPRDRQWWSRDDNNRQRMLDELAAKKAALANAPEIDCRPKPKPTTAVTTGGFQPPALPVRPSSSALNRPSLPTRFCSYDEKIEFLKKVGQLLDQAGEEAVRAARFRTEVEQAVNSYVQNDRPVPPELIARRRQAIADVEAANRRVREAEDYYNRARAIPVVDCREQQKQEPPRTQPPPTEPQQTGAVTPGPKFQSGSLLDDIRNRAWVQVEAMRTAYDRCDPDAYERALRELERLLEEAKLARGAATGAGEFSTVTPEEAEGLVEAIRSIIEPRRWLLIELRRKCTQQPRTQPPATPSQTGFVPPPDKRMATILEEHNRVRAQVGVPRLTWDPQLAAGAASYAAELARTGQRVHAPREGRGAVRENLNQGMLGWSAAQMVQNWLKERQNFMPGTYPDVTRTGRWQDVSHYTQMIWPTTKHIGCGLTSGSGYQWLVCRYSPGGNKDGQTVGLPSNPPVIAQDSGIAPPNSSSPILPRDLPRLPMGGGMTQIDPPPPPPPTASDEAPEGDEARHPLVTYANEADARHAEEMARSNTTMARLELDKMRYALDELKKRLKAARKAAKAGIPGVRPADIQRQVEQLEQKIRDAESRRQGERPPAFPPPSPLPPPPPPPG